MWSIRTCCFVIMQAVLCCSVPFLPHRAADWWSWQGTGPEPADQEQAWVRFYEPVYLSNIVDDASLWFVRPGLSRWVCLINVSPHSSELSLSWPSLQLIAIGPMWTKRPIEIEHMKLLKHTHWVSFYIFSHKVFERLTKLFWFCICHNRQFNKEPVSFYR